jgi:phosphoribosyl-ATP pyrophosphohydrolase
MQEFKDIYSWLEASGIETASDSLLKDLLLEEMKEFFDAKEAGDKVEMKNATIDMIYIVANISYFNGLTIEELTEEFRKLTYSYV